MKPDPKAEPRCAECDDRVDGVDERWCNPNGGACTQDDGPAPEWCPKRGDKKEGPYR